ncbi:MAG TPA: hypothetical protein VNE59_06080 [Burkholderiales bacterium]|nr:hypothetical protein [Burkholderiales bacterium]
MSENRAQYERFDTETGFQSAIDRLLAQPGRELRVFDPDLRALRFDAPQRVALLEQFLVSSRARRLYVALHEPEYVTGHCPRLMGLLARFSHAIVIHRTHEEIRSIQDSFLVLDQRHYVRRAVARFFRGAIGLGDEPEAFAMYSRFQEIWAASFPAVSATTLGL